MVARRERWITRSRPAGTGEETLSCLLQTSAIETALERYRRPCIPGDPRREVVLQVVRLVDRVARGINPLPVAPSSQ